MAISVDNKKCKTDTLSTVDPKGAYSITQARYHGTFVAKTWYDLAEDKIKVWDGAQWLEEDTMSHLEIDVDEI